MSAVEVEVTRTARLKIARTTCLIGLCRPRPDELAAASPALSFRVDGDTHQVPVRLGHHPFVDLVHLVLRTAKACEPSKPCAERESEEPAPHHPPHSHGLARPKPDRHGVPVGVQNGQFGLGLVVDFFGLAAKNSGFPTDFVYPSVTAIVPANIGLVAGARNPDLGKRFIAFALSTEGQELLLEPKVSRRPNGEVAVGIVYEQDPGPGARLAKGSIVTVLVSTGKAKVKIPDVVGSRRDDAGCPHAHGSNAIGGCGSAGVQWRPKSCEVTTV